MKSVAASFSTAIAENTVKITELYVITLNSGGIYRFTNHSEDIVWDVAGNTYLSTVISREPMRFTANLESSTVTLNVGTVTSSLASILQHNVLEGARLSIRRIQWDETYASNKEIILFNGWVDVEFTRDVITLTCKPIGDLLNLKVPRRLYQEPCNYSLFDANCGLIQSDYKLSLTATGGSTNTVTDSSVTNVYDAPFDGGDSANPLVIGDTIQDPNENEFDSDSDCMAVWNMEPGALETDSKGTNTLDASGVSESTTIYKRGDGCAYFGSWDILDITDANLDTDFPLKSGDTNKKISVANWVRLTGLPNSHAPIFAKYTGTNKRSILLSIWNLGGGTYRFVVRQGHTGGTTYEEYISTVVNVGVDNWYHICITYEDSTKELTLRIYDEDADTAYSDSHTFTNNISITDAEVQIGYTEGTSYLTGRIDEMVVFKDIISDAEADELRNFTYGSYTYNTAKVLGVAYTSDTEGVLQIMPIGASTFEDDDILSASGNSVVLNGAPSLNNEFYELGELHMTSGDNAGQRRPILSTTSGVFTVIWPFPYSVQVGDTFDVYPGCDKTGETCKNRFNNEEYFAGFLYVPVVEDVMGGI